MITAPDHISPLIRRTLGRLAEPYVLFPLTALLLLTVIWGATWNLISSERTGAERAAANSTMELAETYEAQAVRALREIDQSLKLIKYAYEQNGGNVSLPALKQRALLPPDLVFAVSIADRTGKIVASTHAIKLKNVSEKNYFRAQLEGDRLAFGRPEAGGADRESNLHFSHRLDDVGGHFAGVAIVTVAAEYFVSGYERSRLGEHGVIGIVGADGVFVARRSGESVVANDEKSYANIAPLVDKRDESLATVNPWDGVRRFTSARPLFDVPLAVIVGLAENEQLADVEAKAWVYNWRAAGGSTVLLLMVGLLGWASWRVTLSRIHANQVLQEEIAYRRRAEAALNLRERAIESSSNAILIIDANRPDYPIEYVNPAFEKITGYASTDATGRSMTFLLGTDHEQGGMHEIRAALRERQECRAVLRNYRQDGTLFWNEFYVAPVMNDRNDVTHFVAIMNDISEAKNYERQLAHQANFDQLTGLANRNLMQDRLQQALASAQRSGDTVVTVFLDLDNFKLINDSLGHLIGDVLLTTVATRLKGCVRESDTVARMGGDEFVLLLHHAKRVDLESTSMESRISVLMHKLLTNISLPVALADREVRPTCSIGISIYPQDGMDADTLIKNADAAMYRAKELGRNRFQFFTNDMHQRMRGRMELESSLLLALEREEFELHYQPQVSLKDGDIIGVEALLRWNHPEKGLIGPDHFIEFAEETGLIIPIGKWALTRACIQNKAWQDAGLRPIPIAVNMSAKQCEQRDIDVVVKRALKSAGLSAHYLELEITESISMANPAQSVPLMQRLKETGVSLSIDDFGTGFSNMSYLKRFPIDRLKIDLSFVREITTDPGSLAIAEAIITMSHSLNLEVVAEGVETEGQLALLRARGCDFMQGFLFSRALTADAFATMLADDRRLTPILTGRSADAPAMLVLDGDPASIAMLKWQLKTESYPLLLASSVDEAFEALARNEIAVLLCDPDMPEMDDVDFLGKVRSMYPDTVRILYVEPSNDGIVRKTINGSAAYRCVVKAGDHEELRRVLVEAFEIYHLAAGAKREVRNNRLRALKQH